MAAFMQGKKFDSFDDLDKKIQQYQKENYVQFYKRDSRTIETAIKRAPKRKFRPEIKYSELVYSCVHGGKKFKSSCTGKRPLQ